MTRAVGERQYKEWRDPLSLSLFLSLSLPPPPLRVRLAEPQFEPQRVHAVQVVPEQPLVPHKAQVLVQLQCRLVGDLRLQDDLVEEGGGGGRQRERDSLPCHSAQGNRQKDRHCALREGTGQSSGSGGWSF